MKANTQPRAAQSDPELRRELIEHAAIINAMTDGRLVGTHNATSTAPTTGSYARGDFVRNSAPSELGTAGSKYVIFGWQCLTDSPLTFVQCRFLTGN